MKILTLSLSKTKHSFMVVLEQMSLLNNKTRSLNLNCSIRYCNGSMARFHLYKVETYTSKFCPFSLFRLVQMNKYSMYGKNLHFLQMEHFFKNSKRLFSVVSHNLGKWNRRMLIGGSCMSFRLILVFTQMDYRTHWAYSVRVYSVIVGNWVRKFQ